MDLELRPTLIRPPNLSSHSLCIRDYMDVEQQRNSGRSTRRGPKIFANISQPAPTGSHTFSGFPPIAPRLDGRQRAAMPSHRKNPSFQSTGNFIAIGQQPTSSAAGQPILPGQNSNWYHQDPSSQLYQNPALTPRAVPDLRSQQQQFALARPKPYATSVQDAATPSSTTSSALPECSRCKRACDLKGYISLKDGSNFHPECFVCDHCRVRLSLKFTTKAGKNYHPEVRSVCAL